MSRLLTLRLTAPLAAVGSLLLAGCLATAWYVHRLQRDASEILSLHVASMRAAEELEIGLREVRTLLDDYLLSEDPRHLEGLPRLRGETDRYLADAEGLATTGREQELMRRVKRGYEHFFAELDLISRLPPQGPQRRQMRELIDRVLTDEILEPAHEYLDLNEVMASEAASRNKQAAQRTVFALVALGVFGPAGGLLAGWGIARRIDRSLVRLTLPIQDATGLLSEAVGPISLAPGWGLDELEAVLRRMASRIGEVIQRMQRSQQEALRAEQLASLGQLAAGVAHELRNPLTSMKILVQATLVRGDGALAGRDLVVIEEEITRLERLTSTLLDYARPARPEKAAFEVGELVGDVAALLSGRAGRRDVRIHCRLPDAPVWLEADAGQVRQVLLNLMLNALEAVPDAGEVRVSLAEEAGEVELVVTDSGPGLPASLGQDVFRPFVSTKPTGLGLGLSICKRLVDAHGGTIAAGAGPEGGASFRVRLPRPAPGSCRAA